MSTNAAAAIEDEWQEDGARHRLFHHLSAIKAQKGIVDEHRAQWRRLQLIKEAEPEARARLDAIKAQDVKELGDQLVNPTGLHVTVDHGAVGEAERDLACATREAEVARGCEAATSARSTAASQELRALEQTVPLLAAAVLIEEAGDLAVEIATDGAKLRGKYARLLALKRFIDERKLPPRLFELVPAPMHPDSIWPSLDDVSRKAAAWHRFADAVAVDPSANFQEE